MQLGDLVRIVPLESNESSSYDYFVGLIIDEDSDLGSERVFRLLMEGSTYWFMGESDLEVINDSI
jgi:hypothetical protein